MTGAARLDAVLAPTLAERRESGLYRARRVVSGPQGARVRIDGRDCLCFCSNDYLGLAGDPRLAAAMRDAAARWGTGSGAAHLITGHGPEHEALEAELADWVGRPRALLFSTGYMANMGVINALVRDGDRVLEDRLNHASLLDGGWLSRAEMHRYPHADTKELAAMLARVPEDAGRLIVTDSVFSMDGDLAPLARLTEVADEHGAHLVIDDAHGIGVLGEEGAGTPSHLGLGPDRLPVCIGTLGKALGTFGAFVAGSETLIEFLIQRARTYIYTTAPPPAVAAATREAVRIARRERWRREHLQSLVHRFRAGAEQLDLPLGQSTTPIQPLMVGDAERALSLSRGLLDDGFLITAIRPPTVPPGTARLRITLTAAHGETDVDRLLEALARGARQAA